MTSVIHSGYQLFLYEKSHGNRRNYMLLQTYQKGKNIIRSIAASLLIGAIVGVIDAVFGRGLLAISDFRTEHFTYLIPFLPIAGLVIVWMYQHFSETSTKGMTLVLEMGQGKRKEIPLLLAPLVLMGTWITHLFGGSAGREGVAVQIGSVVSSQIEQRFQLCGDRKKMLITGMAAGFGGLFQTPLAAVFFAMEVITAGKMEYGALLNSLVAAYTASYTSHFLGLEKFAVPIQISLNMSQPRVLALVILLGVTFGLIGRFFAVSLKYAKEKMSHFFENPYARIGLVSIPLMILLTLLHMGRYSGLGTNLIAAAFGGQTIFAYDWLLKILLTVLTLSIGFQGGEVTPLFSIGASLGVIAGGGLGLPPEVCAALGYAAVFGSATNTLMAPMLIGLEVFGSDNAVAFVLVCVVAYLVNGNRSIYTAQQLEC